MITGNIVFAYAVGLIMTSLLAIYLYFKLKKQGDMTFDTIIYILAAILAGIAIYFVFIKKGR